MKCPICQTPVGPSYPRWCGQCGSLCGSNPIRVPAAHRECERLQAAVERTEAFCRDLLGFAPGGATGAGLVDKMNRLAAANRDPL